MISATLSMDPQTATRAIIEQAIADHPRSAQVEIGASEIGTPCQRKLAHKLAHTPVVNVGAPAWRPTVGTAVHAWLEAAFRAENARLGWDRWLIEMPLSIGEIAEGRLLGGHCDLYDRLTHTCLDFKAPGITTIRKARSAKGPGATYRTQVHLYSYGWTQLGLAVATVAIYYLPAAGELDDGYYWSEPYDAAVAQDALARARNLINLAATMNGWDYLIPLLPIAADFCTSCPWWSPGAAGDRADVCPGVVAEFTAPDRPAFGAVSK